MPLTLDMGLNESDSVDSPVDSAIRIGVRTWNRDSHSLFDYEAEQLNCHQFRLSGGSVDLYRTSGEIVAVGHGEPVPVGSEFLVSVLSEKSGEYRIVSSDAKRLWSVVRENWPEGIKIEEGDVVKLGRFKLRVRQICFEVSDDNTSCSSNESAILPDLRQSSSSSLYAPGLSSDQALADPSIDNLQCRICLSEGPNEDDPLICPCECSGSIRYVHASCIGHWLHGRLGLESGGPAYFFRHLACELCHSGYPVHFSTDGGISLQPIASLPKASPPFIVFENVAGSVPPAPAWGSDTSNTFPSGLHVVELLDERAVKIGRGHDCDVRVSDVSISRLHATIQIEHDGVYLRDEKSKFGTLIALDSSLAVQTSPVSIQAGRSVLTFEQKHY